MNSYTIIVRSEERTIGLGTAFLIIFFLIAGFLFPIATSALRLFFIVVIVLVAHFSIRKFATARTEWTLSDVQLSIKWISQYAGVVSKDININLTEVAKYNDIYGRGYNVFKLTLTNGSVLRFGHGGAFLIDDFDKFYQEFQELYIKNKYPDQWKKHYEKKSVFSKR